MLLENENKTAVLGDTSISSKTVSYGELAENMSWGAGMGGSRYLYLLGVPVTEHFTLDLPDFSYF